MNNKKKYSFTLNLIITEDCNLRCKYCYVHKNPKEISYEVIDKAIEYIDSIKENYSNINVELFGGEPLLAFDKIKYYIEKVKEKKFTNVKSSLFTNGILLNNESISKFIIENNQYINNINLSLDGCEKSHNSTRIYDNGEGSFKEVINGLKTFCKIENTLISRFIPNFTITPENCKYVPDSIKELSALGFTKFSLKPIRDAIWDKKSITEYKNAIIELKEWYIKNINKGIEINLFVLPLIIKEQERPRFCNGGKDFYSIAPQGDIYPCPRFYLNNSPYKLGNIFNKNYFTNNIYTNLFNKYNTSNYVNCSFCKDFKDKKCQGMCIAACYENSGTLFTIIPEVCEIHKFNYKIACEFEEKCKNNEFYQKLRNKRF